MSETNLFPFGYGRAWSEPKATGIRRVFQIGREPATTKTLWWALAASIILASCGSVLLYAFA